MHGFTEKHLTTPPNTLGSDGDKGDVTVGGTGTTLTIDNDAVTYAKMQDVSAASKLLGRGDGGSGDPQEITLGTNLSMSGTTLNAAGGAGAGWTTVEVSVGSTWATAGKFTITDAAITSTSKIIIQQASGPYTGKGTLADEADMDRLSVYAEPATGTAVVRWRTQEGVTMSPRLIDGSGGRRNTTTDNFQNAGAMWCAKRLGRVKGNFKFHYTVA